MPVCALALAVVASAAAQPPVPADTPVQLGVTLKLTHEPELAALRAAQQDPKSPEYRHFLTPQEFGARFGQPLAIYQQAVRWLQGAGLDVQTKPNQTFLVATGTAQQVEALLGIQLVRVEGKPAAVHVPVGKVRLPPALAPVILDISGLDTRTRFRHRLLDTYGYQDFGPQDLRRFYGIQPLLDRGFVGQGQKLAVLSTAESAQNAPSVPAIQYFYSNVSDATAQLDVVEVTPGTTDVDQEPGGGVEYELDMEMQSVASPGADSITMVVSPSSTVFSVGAEYIANDMPDITATSVSLGICEPGEQQNDNQTNFNEIGAFQQAVTQGLAEGQTWSAATGDTGADDCQDDGSPYGATVDFPASLPEEVAMGGTELNPAPFDANNAITQYYQETSWNDGDQGGAGGGGVSILFTAPPYQQLIGYAADAGRAVPDLALLAGLPGVAIDDAIPGPLEPVEGTSVAAPLSAGIFGLVASRIGCRLGDVHLALYTLGKAQSADAGPAVYHDIVSGNNTLDGVTGYSAGPGFDLVTGWGSLDVAALADAWPSCYIADGGVDGGPAYTGLDGGPAYSQCTAIGCPTTGCTTLPEGPSTCEAVCSQQDAGSCVPGQVCGVTGETIYAVDGGAGSCVPGCLTNADCNLTGDAGLVCSACEEECVPTGNPSSAVGDGCAADTDCPSGDFCETGRRYDGGYCTAYCLPPSFDVTVCSCPSGSYCEGASIPEQGEEQTYECFEGCDTPGQPCARPGYVCQPLSDGNPGACLPPCHIGNFSGTSFDSCTEFDTGYSCDTTTGYCTASTTGGTTGTSVTGGGTSTGGTSGGAGTTGGGSGGTSGGNSGAGATGGSGAADGGTTPGKSGCGCGSTGAASESLLMLIGLVALTRRRRLA